MCCTETHALSKLLLPAATKLDQGNVFTGVCDSVNTRGVCLSACWDTPPSRADTPDGSRPPQSGHPPGSRHPPEQTQPWEQRPPSPRSRHSILVFICCYLYKVTIFRFLLFLDMCTISIDLFYWIRSFLTPISDSSNELRIILLH